MEFDLSKENIQPLRGGRNASQLELALQAQTNEDFQRELLHQKEKFEQAIQTYNGDDPLENWYYYISWVEQSYPKHGHEGNLMMLLEDCLAKFENDKRYANDFRFCKLWIKYNDLQQNPLELYHMMHARGLCRGCADLYRAWAYYHEAAGDYRNADAVFQLGKCELAQPYEELTMAHQNMVFAAGQQGDSDEEASTQKSDKYTRKSEWYELIAQFIIILMLILLISGVDQQRLMEQRQALTTLRTYKPGRVGSIRTAAGAGAGILPSATSSTKSNAVIQVYEDKGVPIRSAEVPPVSILSVAKRQVAPKENTIKPGAWTAAGPQWKGATHRGPKYIVHEDNDFEMNGLKLPIEYYPVTHEDFSNWKPALCYPEPEDPVRCPMYPKAKVYSNTQTEYSIEEIKACRYIPGIANRLNVSHIETEQAIQSILGDCGNSLDRQKIHDFSRGGGQFYHEDMNVQNMYQQPGCERNNLSFYQHDQQQQLAYRGDGYQQVASGHYGSHVNNTGQYMQPQLHTTHQQHPQHQQHSQHGIAQHTMQYLHSSQHAHSSHQNTQQYGNTMSVGYQENLFHPSQQQQQFHNISHHSITQQHDNTLMQYQSGKAQPRIFGQDLPEAMMASFHSASMSSQNKPLQNETALNDLGNDMNVLWRSTNDTSLNEPVYQSKKPNISKFTIYEESNVQEGSSKVSAMKTMPFKVLSDAELAETGSRGGHDIAAAAQPSDGAKRTEVFEDDSSTSFSEAGVPLSANYPELNSTCNTQVFNFNLNEMKVSTPQPKQVSAKERFNNKDDSGAVTKQLFTVEPDKIHMSTILEETTKSSGSSSGANCSSIKSTTFSQSKRDNMAVINEEQNSYHFNLAQNLKANAALRTSLLELMDCESGQTSPVSDISVTPLEQAPSDPFKSSLLKQLLNRVGFPGRHSEGYIRIYSAPRVVIRKELTRIGEDSYLIEKSLGKGTYGQVFKANDTKTNQIVALKIQKPANCWEYYICKELQSRLSRHPLKECFMDVNKGYFGDQVSVFVSDFSPCGSLLDVANNFKLKAGHPMKQGSCIYLCIEMLKIVSAMHQVKIIHADIKPDNFLVYVVGDSLQLQLIDFGCSIDMTLFPPDTTFKRRVTTKDFICCEMQDGRPWSYHTDLFCVAATAHVLLFDKYMQLQKKGDQWSITQRFTRYIRVDVWNTFFSSLLNQQKGPADSEYLITFMTEALSSFGFEMNLEMRKLINIINNR